MDFYLNGIHAGQAFSGIYSSISPVSDTLHAHFYSIQGFDVGDGLSPAASFSQGQRLDFNVRTISPLFDSNRNLLTILSFHIISLANARLNTQFPDINPCPSFVWIPIPPISYPISLDIWQIITL